MRREKRFKGLYILFSLGKKSLSHTEKSFSDPLKLFLRPYGLFSPLFWSRLRLSRPLSRRKRRLSAR